MNVSRRKALSGAAALAAAVALPAVPTEFAAPAMKSPPLIDRAARKWMGYFSAEFAKHFQTEGMTYEQFMQVMVFSTTEAIAAFVCLDHAIFTDPIYQARCAIARTNYVILPPLPALSDHQQRGDR